MNPLSRIRFFLCVFVLSSFFLVAERPLSNLIKHSQFGIGPEYVHVNLHVHATKLVPASKFNGNTWGGTAFYEYKEPKGIYLNINGYWIGGTIHGSGTKRHFSDEKIESRFGYNFVYGCSERWKIIPYFGFGYSNIRQTHVGAALATTRTPTYYIPVGCIISYAISDSFQMGTNIKWTPQVDATFKTSAINHGRWALQKKYGLVVELPFTYSRQIAFACSSIKGSIGLVPYWRLLKKGSGTSFTHAGVETPIASQLYNFWGCKLLFALSY